MENTERLVDEKYGEVLDTKKAFLQLLKNESKKIFLGVFLSLIWSFICGVFLPKEVLSSDLGILILLFPWFFIAIGVFIVYLKIREAFWKQLAFKYKWEYRSSKNISHEKALLFTMGHSASTHHGIEGSYNNQLFYIFEYKYSLGYGKHRRTYSFTVFEIKFTGTFPHLYLNYKSDWYSNTPSIFSSLAKISLPPEFEDKFKLYAPKEYEIETLEIFTPDIFTLLLDLNWNHDMEFVDGELIIYQKGIFGNFNDLDAELTKIKRFVDILSPRLNRLKLAQIGDITSLLKK